MLAAVRRREKAASQLGFVLALGPAGPRSRRSQTWHLRESGAVPATPGTSCGQILASGCEDSVGLAAPVSRGAGGSSERRAVTMVEFFFSNRDQIHGKTEYLSSTPNANVKIIGQLSMKPSQQCWQHVQSTSDGV